MVTILEINSHFHLFWGKSSSTTQYKILKCCFMQCTDVKLPGMTARIKAKRSLTVPSLRKTSPCVFSHVSKMAACRGITYLLLQAAAPSPPASDRRSSAGLGCTECGVHAVFPKVWTNGWTNSLSLRRRPSSTWRCCSAAPPLSWAPSVRVALRGRKSHVRQTY